VRTSTRVTSNMKPSPNGICAAAWSWLAALIGLVCFGYANWPSSKPVASGTAASSTNVAAVDSSKPEKGYITQSIRDLVVGTWVLADNPETEGIEGIDYSQLDPAEYRIHLLGAGLLTPPKRATEGLLGTAPRDRAERRPAVGSVARSGDRATTGFEI